MAIFDIFLSLQFFLITGSDGIYMGCLSWHAAVVVVLAKEAGLWLLALCGPWMRVFKLSIWVVYHYLHWNVIQ